MIFGGIFSWPRETKRQRTSGWAVPERRRPDQASYCAGWAMTRCNLQRPRRANPRGRPRNLSVCAPTNGRELTRSTAEGSASALSLSRSWPPQKGKAACPPPPQFPRDPFSAAAQHRYQFPVASPLTGSQEVQISRLRLGHVTTVRVARRLGVRVVRTQEASTNKELRKRARVGES